MFPDASKGSAEPYDLRLWRWLTRADKRETRRVIADGNLWQASRAVLVELVSRWEPMDKIECEDTEARAYFGIRVIVLSPFPVCIERVSCSYEIHPVHGSPIRGEAKDVVTDEPQPNGTSWVYEVRARGLPPIGVPALGGDARLALRVDVSGSVLVRGPWAQPTQKVEFGGPTWLAIYA